MSAIGYAAMGLVTFGAVCGAFALLDRLAALLEQHGTQGLFQGAGDDSLWCNLCDPPHETSIAMWPVHMVREHGWNERDLRAVVDAPVVEEA